MNAAICMVCGDLLHSEHVHAFRACKCGAIFIDGGDEYKRYGGPSRVIYPVTDRTSYNNVENLTPHERLLQIYTNDEIKKDWEIIDKCLILWDKKLSYVRQLAVHIKESDESKKHFI